MSKVFLRRGSLYSQTESNFTVSPTLDEGIYNIHQNPLTGEIFLERISDEFHFGFKLYGIDETLVTHVLDTYNKQETKRNIGVLLNGAKGTGKTVTAKLLANRLGLPVILVNGPMQGLAEFLASIPHDCVFFFDEFEKNFKVNCNDDNNENCAGEDLLSIMDGVYNSDHCHIFLLTTNELKINDNLLSRPSRIRYLKSFGEVIDRKILEEFVKDNLKYDEFYDEIMDFVDSLTIATIDIVKSIVEEVNLHKCHVSEFKDIFNVKEAKYFYTTRTWRFEAGDKDAPSMEAFLKQVNAPYSKEMEWRPNYDSIMTKKSIKKMKVGENLTDRYKIIEMHLDKGYMLCQDNGYRSNRSHFYFENVDAAPSLYDRNPYAYGYYDY